MNRESFSKNRQASMQLHISLVGFLYSVSVIVIPHKAAFVLYLMVYQIFGRVKVFNLMVCQLVA
jgi:hypothetical protein